MNKKKTIIFIVMLILVAISIGCSRVEQLATNAKKNIKMDKTLPIYDLNKENFKEIAYKGKTYQIMEEAINPGDLDIPIGKVSKRVTIDENKKILDKKELMKIYVLPDGSEHKRIDLNFGWVYSIKDTDSNETIAVVVNDKYRKATIKK